MTLFGNDDPKILLYADDTVLYFSHNSATQLLSRLNNGLEKMYVNGVC